MSTAVEDRLLDLNEVARRLIVSRRQVYRLMAAGVLPRPRKIWRRSGLLESDVAAFLLRVKEGLLK